MDSIKQKKRSLSLPPPPAPHLLVDLHADRALGHVPDDAGAAVVEFVGHALREEKKEGKGLEIGFSVRFFFTSLPLFRPLPPNSLTLCTAELTLMST